MNFKLGKKPPVTDPRTLRFARYLVGPLPPILSAASWTAKVGTTWGYLGNDMVGDCVYASKGHLLELFTAYAQAAEFVPTTAQILADYSRDTGYNAEDPSSDQGADMLAAAKAWQALGIVGHKVSAFVSVDPLNKDNVRRSIMTFGHCEFGLALPIGVDPSQANPPAVWDVPPGPLVGDWAPGSLGGHCVPAAAYDANGVTVVTWGALQRVTWAFLAAYADEAFAYLSPDFINAQGDAPSGFDLAALQADLTAVQSA